MQGGGGGRREHDGGDERGGAGRVAVGRSDVRHGGGLGGGCEQRWDDGRGQRDGERGGLRDEQVRLREGMGARLVYGQAGRWWCAGPGSEERADG